MKAQAIVVSIPLFLICFDQNLRADVVTEWNGVALNAIRTSNTPPPVASRTLAILHTAIYDAVNGILCVWQPHLAHFGSLFWPTPRHDGCRAEGFSVLS
jgi:hypothetical protein